MVSDTLGERELDVMAALWESGSGTVAQVKDLLDADIAYTTVLTILRNLEAKRFVRREEEGRGHRYFPLVQQQTARKNALSRLVAGLFNGSHHALLAQLVDQHQVSAEELQQLARQLHAKSQTPRARRAPKERGA